MGECITVFENILLMATLEIERRIGGIAAGDEFAQSLYRLIVGIKDMPLLNFGDELVDIALLLGWMKRENMYERVFSLVVASARLHGLYDWQFKGFVSASYAYGTWWGSVVVYRPTVITDPNDQTPITGYVAVVGGDHCQDCSAKANEIVAWVQKAIEQLPTFISRYHETGYSDRGVVTFAFTRPGADVGAVLDALIANFGNSEIPIIVSWTTSDGRVMYMCIGKASACAALGDLARVIACLQQTKSSSCNAQEVDWRGIAWEAPPPSSETPALQLTP